MTISPELLTLAPASLRIHRDHRYDGSGFGLSLDKFMPTDRAIIDRLYRAVGGIDDLWHSMRNVPDYQRLADCLDVFEGGTLVEEARQLGAATEAAGGQDLLLRKVVHDVRGGGLTFLIGMAGMARLAADDVPLLTSCALTARDHAKIMRNALVDLDLPRREADEAARTHDVAGMVTKWQGAVVRAGVQSATVKVTCEYHGAVTARCLETSAVDRILYNYISNAARFTADGQVQLTIFPVAEGMVRWVVSNSLTADQRGWLDKTTGADLRQLYRGE